MNIVYYAMLVFMALSAMDAVAVSLKGSPESMERQNVRADEDNLFRVSEKSLQYFKDRGLLVPLSATKSIKIDSRLSEKYRWCRPCTKKFLTDLGEEYEARFGRPIQVNSAVRTIEHQQLLRVTNGNAAPHTPGPRQSSHLTGATVDLAKLGMSLDEMAWMRRVLSNLMQEGLIEAVEEHRQAVFHIMVLGKYCEPEKKKKK